MMRHMRPTYPQAYPEIAINGVAEVSQTMCCRRRLVHLREPLCQGVEDSLPPNGTRTAPFSNLVERPPASGTIAAFGVDLANLIAR